MKVTFNVIKAGGINKSLDSFFEELTGISLICKTSFLQKLRNLQIELYLLRPPRKLNRFSVPLFFERKIFESIIIL